VQNYKPMEEKIINPSESFAIIQEMVQKTKQQYSDDSFYFILWGWLTFSAALAHYLLLPIVQEQAALVWLLMPLGGLVSMVYGLRRSRTQKVKTHLETYIGYLWKALGLAMIVVVLSTVILQNGALMPVFILLYAIGTFTTGCFIQFKPLIYGGAVCFALSLLTFFLDPGFQLLMIAVAVLVSYLIPGHALKNKFKRHLNEGA
jgi:hypothetical protein